MCRFLLPIAFALCLWGSAASVEAATSLEECAPRARPLTYPEATIVAARRELHPELAVTVRPIDAEWARRYVAEAFLYTSGAFGDPFEDLPEGAQQYARTFVDWYYDHPDGRPSTDVYA